MTGPFACVTETDVRERIIFPMLTQLGHPPETIKTGLYLKYARRFLGRKKPGKDPILRGRPDYVIEIDARLRIVVEAKEPGEIDGDEREQAYSYAVHAQVGAVIFVMASGTHFEIWDTVAKPGEGLILEFKYEEIGMRWTAIKNVLAPEAVQRRFPKYVLDIGEPLGPGLGSTARVLRGTQTYLKVPSRLTGAHELTIHYPEGSMSRNAKGGILLLLRPSLPYKAMADFQKKIGEIVELETDALALSANPDTPTVFTSVRQICIEEGDLVPDPTALNKTLFAAKTVNAEAHVRMEAHVDNGKLIGFAVARSLDAAGMPCEIHVKMELFLG